MIEFLEIRDDVMLELSTQVATINQTTWNTRQQDETNRGVPTDKGTTTTRVHSHGYRLLSVCYLPTIRYLGRR